MITFSTPVFCVHNSIHQREEFIKNNPDIDKMYKLILGKFRLIQEISYILKHLQTSFKEKRIKKEFVVVNNVINFSLRSFQLMEICKLIDSGRISLLLFFKLIERSDEKYISVNLKNKSRTDKINLCYMQKETINIKVKKLFEIRNNILAHSPTEENNLNKTFHLSDDPNDRNVDDIIKLIFNVIYEWSILLYNTYEYGPGLPPHIENLYISNPCLRIADLFCKVDYEPDGMIEYYI